MGGEGVRRAMAAPIGEGVRQMGISSKDDAAVSADGARAPMRRACLLFESLLEERLDGLGGRGLLGLTISVLGSAVTVCDASRYIYVYARQLGYDIPPYPLAGCGEIREFFRAFGIASVPDFYERAGYDADAYAQLPEKTAVAVRSGCGKRRLLVADVPFCRIEGAIDMRRSAAEVDAAARAVLPTVLSEAAALPLAERILEAALCQGETPDEPMLP